MTKFINRKYIKKCIELILYLLHYKISYQSYRIYINIYILHCIIIQLYKIYYNNYKYINKYI